LDKAAIWQVWGPLLTIAVIFAIRFRRAGRERLLVPARVWWVPLLVLFGVAAILWRHPPPPLGWLVLVLGTAAGGLAGWRRGKLVSLRLDPASGSIMQRVSAWAVLLLLGVVALRMSVQAIWGAPLGQDRAPLAAVLISEALLGVAAGLVVATRLEVYWRARRLLAEHKESE
jgi:hypothetical protein